MCPIIAHAHHMKTGRYGFPLWRHNVHLLYHENEKALSFADRLWESPRRWNAGIVSIYELEI